ncbi:hypothetical protein GNI_054820 [Gregarina niphandrodes]|uniref:Proteasome maturation factor UMP1 n=1 Tax=Gregarina niphandrodes TaxID=110365 RepID=A0A023B8Y4_GRENI|nr:hypothetical protein GNI_054820 [Gregarina niphandrodes]EZG70683.1 hypothetical protein GNI_054820 [Gregarina niphandrodes]|eukprot:XP_011129903.1 hypothetical protein GNI_054820 [Gregarina niphandrodes]
MDSLTNEGRVIDDGAGHVHPLERSVVDRFRGGIAATNIQEPLADVQSRILGGEQLVENRKIMSMRTNLGIGMAQIYARDLELISHARRLQGCNLRSSQISMEQYMDKEDVIDFGTFRYLEKPDMSEVDRLGVRNEIL